MKKSLMLLGGYVVGSFAIIGLKVCVDYLLYKLER